MTRKNRRRGEEFKPVPELEARDRNRNVLKVVRMVSEDDSSKVNGVIMNMMGDGMVPRFKKSVYRHSLFVLDPRLVRPDFNLGFKFGFGSYKAKLEAAGKDTSDTIVSKIGDVCIRRSGHNGPQRELFLPILSEELVAERVAYYETLAFHGVKGLGSKIDNPGTPEIYLGQLDIPKDSRKEGPSEGQPAYDRDEMIDAITTAFTIHGIQEVELGPSFVPGPTGEQPLE